MGAAWGVAPSTAAVQGYLLAHGGPVTDAELREALGLSHRAIRLALASCEEWGIVRRAEEPRRSGRRGPAGRAWVALDDHWEWFHRVIESRKKREGDPVIAILEQCLVEARSASRTDDDAELLEATLAVAARLRARVRSRACRQSSALTPTRCASSSRCWRDRTRRRSIGCSATLADIPEDELDRPCPNTVTHAAGRRASAHAAGRPTNRCALHRRPPAPDVEAPRARLRTWGAGEQRKRLARLVRAVRNVNSRYRLGSRMGPIAFAGLVLRMRDAAWAVK